MKNEEKYKYQFESGSGILSLSHTKLEQSGDDELMDGCTNALVIIRAIKYADSAKSTFGGRLLSSISQCLSNCLFIVGK